MTAEASFLLLSIFFFLVSFKNEAVWSKQGRSEASGEGLVWGSGRFLPWGPFLTPSSTAVLGPAAMSLISEAVASGPVVT